MKANLPVNIYKHCYCYEPQSWFYDKNILKIVLLNVLLIRILGPTM